MTARLAPLEPPFDPEIADTLRRLMGGVEQEPLKLFRTIAHNPTILERFRQTGSSLLSFGTLDAAERETVVHRVTARAGAAYEWGVHAAVFAPAAGVDPDVLWSGEPADIADERQRLLVRLADELHDTATVSDELWAALEERWPPAQLVELVALAGFYRLVSYFVNAFGVEPEAWARSPRAARAP